MIGVQVYQLFPYGPSRRQLPVRRDRIGESPGVEISDHLIRDRAWGIEVIVVLPRSEDAGSGMRDVRAPGMSSCQRAACGLIVRSLDVNKMKWKDIEISGCAYPVRVD